jgi:ATPases with chaperone activity, ATP-binding subunit
MTKKGGVLPETATESSLERDLTVLAALGQLDPVVGRDNEIRRVINILTRRSKNNPVLVGEPGVGKTAIVEGIAQKIASNSVPDRIRKKRIVSLEVASLVEGTTYRGQFEQKLNQLIEELVASAGEVILFIDEIHLLIGAGAAGDSSMDAANILKPYLARGTVQCIGATTFGEYAKYIEKDPALARRFQKVVVPEPTIDDTVAILRALRDKFEAFHGVMIKDSALVAASRLSHRYIADRHLPDKAIDLVDEAAALKRMQVDSSPRELDEINEQIVRLELERWSLQKDHDEAAYDRLYEIDEKLSEMNSRSEEVKQMWIDAQEATKCHSELKEKIENLRYEIEQCKLAIDFRKAAELEHNELKPLEERLKGQEHLDKEASDGSIPKITDEDIELLVCEWTGIPVARLEEKESARLNNLEQHLHERVVGQENAIKSVANGIRIARTGLGDPNRPIGSFLFLGPTGVGKTEVARTLADQLFCDPTAFVRLDMSEYFDKYTVSRLIGASPGYIGYDEGGQLTEAVRRKPFSCVLFDEIEKAHSDVFNLLLQILDEGRLTDSRGRHIDFRNTVIIMTSNIGSELAVPQEEEIEEEENPSEKAAEEPGIVFGGTSKGIGFSGTPRSEDTSTKTSGARSAHTGKGKKKAPIASTREESFVGGGIDSVPSKLRPLLLKTFRPELLNRIDEIVQFSPLSKEDLLKIIDLQLKVLNERLEQKDIQIEVTQSARRWLLDKCYNPSFGARPVRRAIRNNLEVAISGKLVRGELEGIPILKVDVVNGEIVIS